MMIGNSYGCTEVSYIFLIFCEIWNFEDYTLCYKLTDEKQE